MSLIIYCQKYRILKCSTLQFVACALYMFRTKLQLKYMRNNKTFTFLKFKNNSWRIFIDIQQKVPSQKCPITYWWIVYFLHFSVYMMTIFNTWLIKFFERAFFSCNYTLIKKKLIKIDLNKEIHLANQPILTLDTFFSFIRKHIPIVNWVPSAELSQVTNFMCYSHHYFQKNFLPGRFLARCPTKNTVLKNWCEQNLEITNLVAIIFVSIILKKKNSTKHLKYIRGAYLLFSVLLPCPRNEFVQVPYRQSKKFECCITVRVCFII